MNKIEVIAKRLLSTKVHDIKHIRALTSLLGKLGVKSLRFKMIDPWSTTTTEHFGLGLTQTKTLVESKYEYVNEFHLSKDWYLTDRD